MSTYLPPATDRDAELVMRRIGDLVEASYRGDAGAIDELIRLGGPDAVDRWLKAAGEQKEHQALMRKLDALRGSSRIAHALVSLSNGAH